MRPEDKHMSEDDHEEKEGVDYDNIIVVENTEDESRESPILVCIILPSYYEFEDIVRLLVSIYTDERWIRYFDRNVIMLVYVTEEEEGRHESMDSHWSSSAFPSGMI
jgi:hypothetical protein